MSKIRRSNQIGSTMTFVIVGIILTIGLIGTVYVLRQHGEQVRKEQAIATYDKQQVDKKTAEDAKKAAVAKSDNSKSGNTGNAIVVSAAEELPTTGPGNVSAEIIGLGLLTITTISYLSSRRNLLRSL